MEHSVLLNAIYNAGVNGKACQVISHIYDDIHAVVKSGSSYSSPFLISRGVQQGSVLSPTFYLIVMYKLLHSLSEEKAGVSICNLYLGGAAHAVYVRTVETSVKAAVEQGAQISKFAFNHGLTLNRSKTEVVKLSTNTTSYDKSIDLMESTFSIIPQAKCLGLYLGEIPLCQICCGRQHLKSTKVILCSWFNRMLLPRTFQSSYC